jgi:hypothetical protein
LKQVVAEYSEHAVIEQAVCRSSAIERPPVKILRLALIVSASVVAVFLFSCAATQPPLISHVNGAPGFFKGLWQGFIAPIAFIASLFSDHVRIYAFPNAGKWYDFGFMLGIGGFSGGVFAGSRRTRRGSQGRP